MDPLQNKSNEPATWRDIDQIPGIIPLDSIKIDPGLPADFDNHRLNGKYVEIQWKGQVDADWHSYIIISIARVYGETQILIETSDRSRRWVSIRELALLKLHASELNKLKGIK